eukprot:TRINITY_DN528_c0_g2_i1.p1 TRINITY_DN528_c0_g2~~TRINITY_DN528_c0_g2_i1.p1  ORF type:complete len:240 (-),score=48.89 TRINITY_DN528_c0_g2_i1:38-757(-)
MGNEIKKATEIVAVVATGGAIVPALAPAQTALDIVRGRNVVDSVVSNLPVVQTVKNVAAVLSGARVVVIDDTGTSGALGASWWAGSLLMSLLGRFDYQIKAHSWHQVAKELLEISSKCGGLKEVQFWGHGSPGEALIGSDAINADVLEREEWKALVGCFRSDALWWFRSCSTFNEAAGKSFAEKFSRRYNVRVGGYTQIIGAIQDGLQVLRPGDAAQWADGSSAGTNLATDMGHHLLGN